MYCVRDMTAHLIRMLEIILLKSVVGSRYWKIYAALQLFRAAGSKFQINNL